MWEFRDCLSLIIKWKLDWNDDDDDDDDNNNNIIIVLVEAFLFVRPTHIPCGAHPASYAMGTRDSFHGGKAAGEWSWPLTSN